jgi:hypothetical protein
MAMVISSFQGDSMAFMDWKDDFGFRLSEDSISSMIT